VIVSTRPGPEEIAPGRSPGGVVLQVYDRANTLLVDDAIPQGLTDAEINRRAEADAAAAAALAITREVCIVAFDGDTGVRIRIGGTR
jgi:hypothetical protein